MPWNGKVYALPGPYATWIGSPTKFPYYIFDTTAEVSGSTVSTAAFAGTGNESVFPAIAVPYKQRLALMNFGRGYENTIAFTDDYTADVVGDDLLSSNGRAISLVAGADGDEIVAGIEVMLTNVGSPAESGLLILRKYGTPFLLTGDMDQTGGGESTLDIKRISVNCGCAGPYTVVRTPHGIIWAGIDDVWAFAAGVIPTRVGQKIQPALKLTPNQLQYRWSAAYFDGFYRLAVYGEGQSLAATSAPGDQWWLDLDDGLPRDWRSAEWWGPQQFLGGPAVGGTAPTPTTWNIVPESRAGKDACLFYTDRTENDGASPAIYVGRYGTGPRDLTIRAALIADHDYVDPEITCELITKGYMLQPPYSQLNDGLAFTAHPSSPIQLTTRFILDDGEYYYDTTKYMTQEGFVLGSTRLGTKATFKKQKSLSFYPSTRRAAMQHRFKLTDTAGWVIVTGYNDCLYIVVQDVPNAISYQTVVTVDAGAYSISDLADAVVTAYNAAKLFGNDWSASFSSGILELDGGGPYATSVDIAIRFAAFPAEEGTAPTAAQLAACLKLANILGFDTAPVTAISDRGLSPLLIGTYAPFKKGVSRLEMHSMQANFDVIPRTP